MRLVSIAFVMIAAAGIVVGQTASELTPTRWGVVLDSPAAKKVIVKKDVTYL